MEFLSGICIQYVSLKTVITGPDKKSSGSGISGPGIHASELIGPRIECRTRKNLKSQDRTAPGAKK